MFIVLMSLISFLMLQLLLFSACFMVLLYAVRFLLSWRRNSVRRSLISQYGAAPDSPLVAFFHPFCQSGGGGERVLWTAVQAMCTKLRPHIIVIYTADEVDNQQDLLTTIAHTFNIRWCTASQVPRTKIHFVKLRSVALLNPNLYPMFTIGLQFLGSLIVGLEALVRCPPDLFLDTTGFAATLALAKWLADCRTSAYVHYPTISSDMLDRIRNTDEYETMLNYNNAEWIRTSQCLSHIKLLYYHLLWKAYSWFGCPSNLDLVMTNSTWTQNHIRRIFGGNVLILYPPCPLPLKDQNVVTEERMPHIMSIGQFRPEKNHELQLSAFRLFLIRMNLLDKPASSHNYRLLLIGGCRNDSDQTRVRYLQQRADKMGLSDVVHFQVNVSYNTLQSFYHTCTINLHSMIDEHFGIGIVEGMAHGLITIAHNSGGPKADIIGPCVATVDGDNGDSVGFLATDAESYADCFTHVLTKMTSEQMEQMRLKAFERTEQLFSEDCFKNGWIQSMESLMFSI